LAVTAIFTRLMGKAIAVISGFWILAWSLMTYTNVMETAYCTTAEFSLHSHGWMRLWNFDVKQFVDIKVAELWCLVFGAAVAYCACVAIFAMTSEPNPKKDQDLPVMSDRETRDYRYWSVVTLVVGFAALVAVLTHEGIKGIRNTS
jgi:hypothetical protein